MVTPSLHPSWKAHLPQGLAEPLRHFLTTEPSTDLIFQRHVVHLRVQQHGAGTEGHGLVGDGPRCPAVHPQDLLLAGDDQLLLRKSRAVSVAA